MAFVGSTTRIKRLDENNILQKIMGRNYLHTCISKLQLNMLEKDARSGRLIIN